jgi:hypothetical protein
MQPSTKRDPASIPPFVVDYRPFPDVSGTVSKVMAGVLVAVKLTAKTNMRHKQTLTGMSSINPIRRNSGRTDIGF